MVAVMREYRRKPALRDSESRNRLIEANVGLVHVTATRLARRHESQVNAAGGRDELVSAGLDALMRAAELFDESKGFRFSTYAVRAIETRMNRHIWQFSAPLRRSCSLVRTAGPDAASPRHVESADLCVAGGPGPGDQVAESDHAETCAAVVHEALARLRPRYAQVLRLRYGIGCEPHNLIQIGEAMGVSKQRAAQLAAKAVAEIRYYLGSDAERLFA